MTPKGQRPRKLTLAEWDAHYSELLKAGLQETDYGGALGRHIAAEGDLRLSQLSFDSSAAALRLWNFVLTENRRLRAARARGERLVGTMKDLGTIPVMAYALPAVRAFYPDGAWWTPCLMECSDGLLQQAERLGLDGSFCPVRAMVPAFLNEEHFPRPDLLICSTGAVCDDFSAVAQRLQHLGSAVLWWEMPRRRPPEPSEAAVNLPGNLSAPSVQVEFVRDELKGVARALEDLAGRKLDEPRLHEGIREANRVRRLLAELRALVYGSPGSPLPALEMLLAEMLALHFCSDRRECAAVLRDVLATARQRARAREYVIGPDAVRVFWVNPVADLRAMNLLEEWGGRICGSDYMFTHALDLIQEDTAPLEALARTALADPMVGPVQDRAERIALECRALRCEAVVISRIPGASHCAREGEIIRRVVREKTGLPALELEVPPVCDGMAATLGARLQALMETARAR